MNTQHSEKIARFWAIEKQVKSNLEKEGGFTFDLDGNTPSEGWVTSDPSFTEKCSLKEFLSNENSDCFSFLVDNEHELSRPNRYFGVWLDKEDNSVYLDVSHIYSEKEQAMSLAKWNKEKAIFNLGTGEEFRV